MASGEGLLRPRAAVFLSLAVFSAHSFHNSAVAWDAAIKAHDSQSRVKVPEGEFIPKLLFARTIGASGK